MLKLANLGLAGGGLSLDSLDSLAALKVGVA